MSAHVTFTSEGVITSIALGDGALVDDEELAAELDLPPGFPKLSGPNAEHELIKAVERLRVKPGTATIEARS